MVGGLTPILLSRSTSRVATAVLYAHPHISEGNLDRFINNVQKPSSILGLDSKVPLVHHLTVRPTPLRPKEEELLSRRPTERGAIDASLPNLTRLFPILSSFVLRDCLIYTHDDAIILFTSLPLMKPKKARLELRMWSKSNDTVGRDLDIATNFDTRGLSRPHSDGAQTLGYHGNVQRAWRDAVFADRDMDIPATWLEPDPEDRVYRDPLADRLPVIDVVTPHPFPNPHNLAGPLLQVPVAGRPPLSRAIELCRDVYRSDFARTSVPNEVQIFNELVRMGPFRPQMTRQHAALVLRRLGHHTPDNAPAVEDVGLVDKANKWANFARTKAISHANRATPAAGIWSNQAQGSSSTTGPTAENEQNMKRHVDISAKRALLLATARHDLPDLLASPGSAGSQSASMYIEDDDDRDDADEALFQEAMRLSRLHCDPPLQQGEGSTSALRSSLSVDEIPDDTSTTTLVNSAAQGESHVEDSPQNRTQAPTEADSALAQDADKLVNPDADVAIAANYQADPMRYGEDDDHSSSGPAVMPSAVEMMIRDTHQSDNMATVMHTEEERLVRSLMRDDLGPRRADRTWHDTGHIQRQQPLAGVSRVYALDDLDGTASESDSTLSGPSSIVDDLMIRGRNLGPQYLVAAIRKQLLHLIENTWSPTLQAFSLVALDPLASLIAQSPQLDFWVNVAIPHIRVQLPRGVNSLAIFKGAQEHIRDRQRSLALMLRGARSPQEDNHNTATGPNDSHSSALRIEYPVNQIVDPIVGGDGSGGGLVHPETRLFEVEVNTAREMMDESWDRAGPELPPQVCRILTGIQDWSQVGLRT